MSAPLPLVSVVIPVRNRADLVGRAMATVLGQSMADLELIVVDDASTDPSVDVVRRFRDPRVRLLELPEHAGVSRARNAGIAAARGEWVAFLDSDDEWLPGKLERQLVRLREAGDPRVSVVYCPYYRVDHAIGHRVLSPAPLFEGDVLDDLLGGWSFITSVFLVRRAALLAVGGFSPDLACSEDYELWVRLAHAGNHFAAVAEALVVKHHHLGSHLSTDAAARARAIELLEQRWGALVERRLGPRAHRRWRAQLRARAYFIDYMRVRDAVARGERAAGWGLCLRMVPSLPRSAGFLLRALVLVGLGPGTYGWLSWRWNAARRRPRRPELS